MTKKNYFFCGLVVPGLFILQAIAAKIGSLVANLFNYTVLDPDNLFMFLCVHHIVQAIIGLIVIVIIYRVKGISFNLKPKVSKDGIKFTALFIAAITVYVSITYFVGYKSGTIAPYDYELNERNCLGYLGFQLLLSGPSEEILFRALPITVLSLFDTKSKNKWVAIIISAVLFGIAHIGWSINPFTLSVSWFQVVYAFILGVAYGITYIKSKSIIYPMVMHSMSNVIMVGTGYILYGII